MNILKGEMIIRNLSITLFAAVLLFTTQSWIHPAIANELPPKVPASIKYLEQYSGGTLTYTWNLDTNTPSMLTGVLSRKSKHSPSWIAYEFLHKWKRLYGIRNPKHNMRVVQVEQKDDKTIVHLQHLLFQVPVWEDYLRIEISKDGVIRHVEGIIHPHLEKKLFNRPMQPAISKRKAIVKARAEFHGKLSQEPIVDQYYFSTHAGTPLIYVVKLQYGSPNMSTTTYIHSLSGRIIRIDP